MVSIRVITFCAIVLILIIVCILLTITRSLHLGYMSDNPLFLSQHIDAGSIDIARRMSRVGDLPNAPDVESYSGFISVNKEHNSNMFFWFFPAENKSTSLPLLLWLQDGSGQSSLFGVFMEHGPYIIQSNLTAVLRENHLAQSFNIIYVDNPIGVGFSFTEDKKGYATNLNEMADDMYEFLRQFFTIFHEYKNTEFYVAGESFAGKYVVSLAHKIHSMGTNTVVNLTGIIIRSCLCDPESMMNYSEYLYNIGLIDDRQAKVIKNVTDNIVKNIKKEDYTEAYRQFRKLFIKDKNLFERFMGLEVYHNFVMSDNPPDLSYYLDYIDLPQLKRALHLENMPYQEKWHHLSPDIMKSVKQNLTVIMNNYKVLIVSGQLDVIVPYPSTLNFLKNINWKYSKEYKTAVRNKWFLKNSTEIAGYVHNVGNFYEVLVRNAGHTMVYDKPEMVVDLISRFVNNQL